MPVREEEEHVINEGGARPSRVVAKTPKLKSVVNRNRKKARVYAWRLH